MNPSPKGKNGVGREGSLNHLRPEGYWDYKYSRRRSPYMHFMFWYFPL